VSETVELVRAFLNTLDVEQGADEIGDRGALRSWLAGRGLAGARARVTDDDVALAHRLRAALRDMVDAHSGRRPGPTALSAVNDVMAALPLRLAFDEAGGAELVAAGDGVRGGLAQLLAAVVVAVGEGHWSRLKLCDEDSCRWAFHDQSKNASKRWCSMSVCGNRAKTRSYRQRRKDGG
jgi:predicted RNA-binding Zn ribbon-like protein